MKISIHAKYVILLKYRNYYYYYYYRCFGVRVSVMFLFMFVQYTFSSAGLLSGHLLGNSCPLG